MNKIARNLIKNSPIKRKWTALSNYTTTPSYVNPLADTLLHKIELDYTKNAGRLNSSNIRNVEDNSLENFETHSKNVCAKVAIQLMHAFYKENVEYQNISYKDLKYSNEFLNMCKIIQKGARLLNIYDIIYALRMLASLNVPTNTLLMQTLLQLIRVFVNDLSIGQIMFIHYILCNVEECPLSTSLKIALCKVFRVQAEFELCSESTNLLKAFRFSNIINDTKTKQLIIGILLKSNRALDNRSILEIIYMLYSLPKLDINSRAMLYSLKRKIIENATTLEVDQIHLLLYYVSTKFTLSRFDFYDEEMINELCAALLNKTTTLEMDINILKELNRMRYASISFLNKLAQNCIDSDELNKFLYTEINHIIDGFVIADYRPHCWAVLKTMIEKFVNDMDYSLGNGAHLAFRLLSLDCYCPRLLENVFTLYNKIPNDIKTQNVIAVMLKLHWCVKLFHPEYNGIMIDENKAQEALTDKLLIQHRKNRYPSIIKDLVEAVGGDEYIKYGARTKFGKFVDYLVVVQPNGTPVNISHYCSTMCVEDLEPTSNCTKIPIFVLKKSAYSTNGRNMASTVKLQLKAIEMMSGLRPFVINPYLWPNLSSTGKVLHLRDAIKPIGNSP